MKRQTRLLILTTGVASLAAIIVGAGGCSSGRRVDLVSRGADALADSDKESHLTFDSNPKVIDDGIERFKELFENFDPASVERNASLLYSRDAYFNDGFAELRGGPAIAEYLGRAASGTVAIDVEIEDVTITEDGVYIRWIMDFTTNYRSLTIVAPGISHLRFGQEGQIIYHRDYWDASAALAEFVPFAGSILRSIRSRF